MLLVRDFTALPNSALRGAVTIGNFDGVHRGHAHLIGELVQAAKLIQGPAVVVTFEPHPLAILRPELTPERLTWIERKAELLGGLGVTHVVVLQTNRELLGWEAMAFFERILQQGLQAQTIVEGPNFHFGKDRGGDISLLRRLCAQNGIALQVVQPYADAGEWISSTRIRLLLSQGKLVETNALLTAPYALRGTVITGAKRGRSIGFPTLNLAQLETMLPGHGAYAGRIKIAQQSYRVALNIGPNPTFDEQANKVEAHVLDWSGDLYDQRVEIELLDKLRDIHRFDNVEQLIAQLKYDLQQVRQRVTLSHNE